MDMSKLMMIDIIKRRGWKSLRVKIGSALYNKYGANCPVDECPEHQIRAIYMSGKHYVSPRTKDKSRGQHRFDF